MMITIGDKSIGRSPGVGKLLRTVANKGSVSMIKRLAKPASTPAEFWMGNQLRITRAMQMTMKIWRTRQITCKVSSPYER